MVADSAQTDVTSHPLMENGKSIAKKLVQGIQVINIMNIPTTISINSFYWISLFFQFFSGELKSVSIARALIPHPSLIVADEPVSMIAASRRMIIINLFMQLKERYIRSFLYISHDLATANYISDYIAVMNKGSVVEFGAARQVMGNRSTNIPTYCSTPSRAPNTNWSASI